MTKTLALATVIASLSATPALAAAASPASSLSLAPSARAAKATGKGERLQGTGAIVVGVLAAGIVAGGIIAVANDDDDSDSN